MLDKPDFSEQGFWQGIFSSCIVNHERSLEGFSCVFDTAAPQDFAIQLVGLAKDVAVPREGFCNGGLPGGNCYEK